MKHEHDGHAHGTHSHGAHSHGGGEHGPHDYRRTLTAVAPEAHRRALNAREGRGKILFFDAPTGLAGDMIIAALVDLGVPTAVVANAVQALGLEGVTPVFHSAMAGAIGAAAFLVEVTTLQPHRCYAEIVQLLRASALPSDVRVLAERIFERLAVAEAEVHRVDVGAVHFHEVGAADAIVDIVGAAACIVYLGAEVACSPLPLGHGTVHCEHGTLPVPAPATLLCLRGVPTIPSDIQAELVTPTGAAIIGACCGQFATWVNMSPIAVGWGAGTLTLPHRPNALRVVLGTPFDANVSDRAEYTVVEANIDDMTGELAGHAMERLLMGGALDAWAAPVTMKKGRPGLVLSALAPVELESHVAALMLRETSSIGVRTHRVLRTERSRYVVCVNTPFGEVSVKVSGGNYGPERMKPEFDQCVALAAAAGVPVHEVLRAADIAAQVLLAGSDS